MSVKMQIDGIEYQIPEAVANKIHQDAKDMAGLQKRMKELEGKDGLSPDEKEEYGQLKGQMKLMTQKKDAAEGRADELQVSLDSAKKELEAVKSQRLDDKAIDARVTARLDLLETARPHLTPEHWKERADKSDRGIRELVIQARNPNLKLDGKSDEYVMARFDAVVEQYDSSADLSKSVDAAKRAGVQDVSIYQDAVDTVPTDTWKQPLDGNLKLLWR